MLRRTGSKVWMTVQRDASFLEPDEMKLSKKKKKICRDMQRGWQQVQKNKKQKSTVWQVDTTKTPNKIFLEESTYFVLCLFCKGNTWERVSPEHSDCDCDVTVSRFTTTPPLQQNPTDGVSCHLTKHFICLRTFCWGHPQKHQAPRKEKRT